MAVDELWTRLLEWCESLQKDAPMDLWLQALILLVFCVGFNATSWLLAPQKGGKASSIRVSSPKSEVKASQVASVPSSVEKSPSPKKSPAASPAKGPVKVTPIFTFEGAEFDGDRIVNLREKPYNFQEHLGGALSISFIARWDAFALRSRIIDFGDGPTADNLIIANLETGRSLIVEVFRGPSKKRLTMPGCLALGETHRYLLSISETGLIRMLQDGSQLGVQPQGYAPRSLERRKLLIGGSNWSSDENFQGEISELRIWRGEVSWQQAFPEETPLPPPRLPKEVEPEVKPEPQADDLVDTPPEQPPEPEAYPQEELPSQQDDEEGWTAVSKSTRKAEKKAKAKNEVKSEVKSEVKKPVVVPAPPPPPDHSKRQKGARNKTEAKLSPPVLGAVSHTTHHAPVHPPTPPPPPEHREHKAELPEAKEHREHKAELPEEPKLEPETKQRTKAWADIPPEGTPPNSPPPSAGLVLTVKSEASEVLSPHMPAEGEDALHEDAGFEVLTGKRRPKVQPEVVMGPGDLRPKGLEPTPTPVNQGTFSPTKALNSTPPSSLSPLDKDILRLEKKQREVEKLKQRQADGEELDHLQLKKLSCESEMTQRLQQLQLKKALEGAMIPVNPEGDGGSPEPWDLPKVPMPQAITRTPLRAPREGFRPSRPDGETQLSSGAEIFTPGAMNAEVQFQALQMQQMAMVGGGVEMVNQEMPSEESWDACWEWLQNGFCPRGETCRWDHPPLQFPDGSLAVWPNHQPEDLSVQMQPTEQVFVMVPAENFPCQGPYTGDQMAIAPMACGCACDPMAMPCSPCVSPCPDGPFSGDGAVATDGQPAR